MRKFLLFMSLSMIGATAYEAQAENVRFINFGKRHTIEAIKTQRATAKKYLTRAEQLQIWRPATVTDYGWAEYWDDGTSGWKKYLENKVEYNSKGFPVKYTNENEMVEYVYDEEDRCIRVTYYSVDGVNEAPSPFSKQEFAYDTVVKNLVIGIESYRYSGGLWSQQNGERTVITRNSDGNVIKVEGQLFAGFNQGSDWEPYSLVEIGYGKDGKANSIRVSFSDEDEMAVESEISDIVWERTNGQIIIAEMGSTDLFSGDNRIKSAKALGEYTYPYVADIYLTVDYKANNGGYKSVQTMNNETFSWTDYTVVNEYGSYRMKEFEYDWDYDDVTDSYFNDGPQLYEEVEIYDKFGLQLESSEIYYIDGDETNGIDDSKIFKGEVTYDDKYGYPLVYETYVMYDYTTEPHNLSRRVFGDYKDVSTAGVDDVINDENGKTIYYNLQGQRVNNPENGIFIRRQGGKTSKVVIR